MSGQGVSSGMLSATSNEALQTSLANIQDPELHKLASFVIGRTLGHDVGGAVSSIATEENWLNHYDQMALLADIINYKQSCFPNKHEMMNKLAYYIALSNRTAPYAEQLGINDGIDNSFNGLDSLALYAPIGTDTLAAGASLGISAVGIGQIGYGSAVTGMAGSNLLDDMQTLFAKRNKESQATEALTTETKQLTRAQEFEKSLVHLLYYRYTTWSI